MPTRKIKFLNDGYYHVYNRGVEKRDIVMDNDDIMRFLVSLNLFNTTESIGSIFDYNQKGNPVSFLVEIVAFNVLNNHFHLVLKQLVDGGISIFMKSLSGGYTKYFNEKYDRVGSLFQGPFKAANMYDERLERIIAYVNLNHVVHKLGNPVSKWGKRGSWDQYVMVEKGIVEISKWASFDKEKSIKIINEIIEHRKELKDLTVGDKRETRFSFYGEYYE